MLGPAAVPSSLYPERTVAALAPELARGQFGVCPTGRSRKSWIASLGCIPIRPLNLPDQLVPRLRARERPDGLQNGDDRLLVPPSERVCQVPPLGQDVPGRANLEASLTP